MRLHSTPTVFGTHGAVQVSPMWDGSSGRDDSGIFTDVLTFTVPSPSRPWLNGGILTSSTRHIQVDDQYIIRSHVRIGRIPIYDSVTVALLSKVVACRLRARVGQPLRPQSAQSVGSCVSCERSRWNEHIGSDLQWFPHWAPRSPATSQGF